MPPVSLLATLLATVLSFVLGGPRGMSFVNHHWPLRCRGQEIAVRGWLWPVLLQPRCAKGSTR
jgi:hypothetical protein